MNPDLAQGGSNNYSATYWGNLDRNSRNQLNRFDSILHSVSEHQLRESGDDCSKLLSAETIDSHYINEYCKFIDNKKRLDDGFARTASDSVKQFSFHFRENSLNKPVMATTGESFDLHYSQQTACNSDSQFDMYKVLNESKKQDSSTKDSPACETDKVLNKDHGDYYFPTNPYFHTRNMASHNFTFFGLHPERGDDDSLSPNGGSSANILKKRPSEMQNEVSDVGKGQSAKNGSPAVSDRYHDKGPLKFGYGLASVNLATPHKSTEGKGSQIIIERLWEGSLQLNTTTKVSAVAYFKSGEKADDISWSQHIEVKGKVRLQAFEKFIQELPRSRSRSMMVISLCCDMRSSKDGTKSMKEVSKHYKDSERVGFAQIAPRIDLYVCPRSDTIITILAKHGFFKGMAAVDDDQDSLIGCVVWRRDQASSNTESQKLKKKENPPSENRNSPEFSNLDIHSPLMKPHGPNVKQSPSSLSQPVHLHSLVQVDTENIPLESRFIPVGKQRTIDNAVQNMPPLPCNSPTPNMQNPLEASQISSRYVLEAKSVAVHSGAPPVLSQVPPMNCQMRDTHNNSSNDPTYVNIPNVDFHSPHTMNHGPAAKQSAADIWQPSSLHSLHQSGTKNMLFESRITPSGEGSSTDNAVQNIPPLSCNSPTPNMQNPLEASQISRSYVLEARSIAVHSGAPPVLYQVPRMNCQMRNDTPNSSGIYDPTYVNTPNVGPAAKQSAADVWQPSCLHSLLQSDTKNMLSESRITLYGEGSSTDNAVPNSTPFPYNFPTIPASSFFLQKSISNIFQNSMEHSQMSSGHMVESKNSAVYCGAPPVPSHSPPSNSQVDSNNPSRFYANPVCDPTHFISSHAFQVPASQMSVGDNSHNPAPETKQIDTGLRTTTIGLPGPPPLQSEIWKQSAASYIDKELSKGVPNARTLVHATELEKACMLSEQISCSHSGPSTTSIITPRSVNVEEDDLPEFDFSSACGIPHWSRNEPHQLKHGNSLVVDHSDRLPLEVNKKAGDVTHSLTPISKPVETVQHPRASFFPDNTANAQRVTGNSYDNNAADKGSFFALKRDMDRESMAPSAIVSVCETQRSRWSDDDDDMPEWCPPDIAKSDKPIGSPRRQPLVVLDTFPGTSASRPSLPAHTPIRSSSPKRELGRRYHDGLLGPCHDGLLGPRPSGAGASEPQPNRPAIGHAQGRPSRPLASSRYNSRIENRKFHDDSPSRGWRLSKHPRHS